MSLRFCIDKAVLGTAQHLVYDDGSLQWVDAIPAETWTLSLNARDEWCLQTLLRLNGHELEATVPERYIASMKTTMKNDYSYDRVPWQKVMPLRVFKTFLTGLVKNVLHASGAVDTGYYIETFSRVTPLFNMLEHAAINVPQLEAYLNDPKTVNPQTLKTFKPIAGSFARKVEYNRFGTRTGRLTHLAGPDILTLKREYRNVITSCFPGGSVRYVDFSSLEARVILATAGHDNLPRDIYADICSKLLPAKSRKVMKLIVLATVFGSGHTELQRLSGLSEKKMTDIQAKIRDMFALEKLEKNLRSQFRELNGKIKNAYGRIVVVPEERTLVNSFVQSTGVDVALLGFQQMVTEMKGRDMRARPIFILHDAILIDTPPNEVEALDQLVSEKIVIPGMTTPFYADATNLYTTT